MIVYCLEIHGSNFCFKNFTEKRIFGYMSIKLNVRLLSDTPVSAKCDDPSSDSTNLLKFTLKKKKNA